MQFPDEHFGNIRFQLLINNLLTHTHRHTRIHQQTLSDTHRETQKEVTEVTELIMAEI